MDKNCITFHLDFCPGGPLGGNFGHLYTIFCPTGPLDGNFDKRFTKFIWIFFKPPISIFPNPALHASIPGRFNFPKAGDTRFKSGRGALSLKSRHSRRTCHKTRGVNSSKAGASRFKTGGEDSNFHKPGFNCLQASKPGKGALVFQKTVPCA